MTEPTTEWVTIFHLHGEVPWEEEHWDIPLQIGEGFIDASSGARRLRVVDIWYSTDKHSEFGAARHVFLENVSGTPDDLPQRLAPDYFSD